MRPVSTSISKPRPAAGAGDLVPIGVIDHRGPRRGAAFGIAPDDMLRGVYILGKTGTGKTTLLEGMVVAQMEAGQGCAIVDPHGDLAERVLALVPRWRTNDVVLIDGSDVGHVVGLNLLECPAPSQRHLVASTVISIFRKLYGEFWGPRMQHCFLNTLLAVLAAPNPTLLSVPRMLSEPSFRAKVLAHVTDDGVRHFWEHEFARMPAGFAAEVVAPVQNKVGAALASPLLRAMFAQSRSAFSFRGVMDAGQILIARLPKGLMGEDASAFLGAVLVGGFQMAAYSRADTPEGNRRPFALYVDEFPSMVTDSFAGLLSEGRKYGLALVLAHQHVDQLEQQLQSAVLGNAGTIVAFRMGARDAERLGPEFTPEFAPGDLTRLGRHQVALRLSIQGVTSVPFSAVTLPPRSGCRARADIMRAVARERYSIPVVTTQNAPPERSLHREVIHRPAAPVPPYAQHLPL